MSNLCEASSIEAGFRSNGNSHCFVIVSGIPGSGKTTLARELAARLELPHFDKDEFLERLFASGEPPTLERRATSSREADALFEAAAMGARHSVLSSWWRHPLATTRSGTPIEWLLQESITLVEIHCKCPAELASVRFLARRRHPGHGDGLRDREDVRRDLEESAARGPLFPCEALVVETAVPLSLAELQSLAEAVRDRLGCRWSC